jgi:P-type Ca2+ transporter type 2C
MIRIQIMIIFVSGSAFSVAPLNLVQWCYSVVLAALCLPFGIVVRLIPDKLFQTIHPPFSRRRKLASALAKADGTAD